MNFLRRLRRRRQLSWEEEFGAGSSAGLYRPRGHSDNKLINFWNTSLGWEADPWDGKLIARRALLRSVLIALLVMLPVSALSWLIFRGDAYAESYAPPAPAGIWRAAAVPFELPDRPVYVLGATLSLREIEQMRDSFAGFFTAFDAAQRTGDHTQLQSLLSEEFYQTMAASIEDIVSRDHVRVYGMTEDIARTMNIDEATPNNAPVEVTASLSGFFSRYEQNAAGEFLPETEEYIARFGVQFVKDASRDLWLIDSINIYLVQLEGPSDG